MNLKLLIFFSIVSIASCSLQSAQKLELSNAYKNLLQAFNTIIHEVTDTYAVKCLNFIPLMDHHNEYKYELMVNELLKHEFEHQSIRILKLDSNLKMKLRFSVILADNFESFKSIEEFVTSKLFMHSGFHFVILIDGNLDDVHEIFDTFWYNKIYNTFVLLNQNGTILTTFNPFENPSKCSDSSPKIINRFVNGEFTQKIDLDKKFSNMNKCTITATTFTDGIASYKVKFSNGSFVIRGFEADLIQTLAKMLNFTLNLQFRDGEEQWGMIYDNGTATETLRDLQEKRTDIILGNYFLRLERVEMFDCSVPYINYQVFLTLSPTEKLSIFEKLLCPFQAAVWILLLLTVCFGIGVIVTVNLRFKALKPFVYGYKVHNPVTNLYAVLIGTTQTQLPKRNFARFILMMFMLLCLVIRNTYQGSLYKFLQSDVYNKQPQTIMELIDKKYIFLVSGSNSETIKKYHSDMKYQQIKSIDLYDIDNLVTSYKKTALFTTKLELMYYSQTHTKYPYQICKEDFYMVNIVMYFNKNFFLKTSIDEALQRIQMSGLLNHWLNNYDATAKWKNIKRRPRVMTFDHLSGAFYLLLIGTLIASFVFGIEILAYKLKGIDKGYLFSEEMV